MSRNEAIKLPEVVVFAGPNGKNRETLRNIVFDL